MKKIAKKLQEFFKEHPDETFYAMAVDAGYLYLNSEEEFAKKLKKMNAMWLDDTALVTEEQARAVDPQSGPYRALAYHLRKGVSFEEALAQENSSRAEDREAGNPYEDPESDDWESLRFGTGNFAYGELVNLNIEKDYMAHYESDDDAQLTSAYAKKVATILRALRDNQATLLAGVKLSDDFRIYAAEHGY